MDGSVKRTGAHTNIELGCFVCVVVQALRDFKTITILVYKIKGVELVVVYMGTVMSPLVFNRSNNMCGLTRTGVHQGYGRYEEID